MNVSELEGAKLNYWAAKADPRCQGLVFEYVAEKGNEHYIAKSSDYHEVNDMVCIFIPVNGFRQAIKLKTRYLYAQSYEPSTDWSQGGPIIEREKIKLEPIHKLKGGEFLEWNAKALPWQYVMEGPTALIAAMRAFVASRFGVEVDDC